MVHCLCEHYFDVVGKQTWFFYALQWNELIFHCLSIFSLQWKNKTDKPLSPCLYIEKILQFWVWLDLMSEKCTHQIKEVNILSGTVTKMD